MTAVLVSLWAIRTLPALLWQVALWQTKEYRLDRLRAHLALPSAARALLRPYQVFKWGALGILLFGPHLVPLYVQSVLVSAAYTGEIARAVLGARNRTLRRPRLTARSGGVLLSAALLLVGVLLVDRYDQPSLPVLLLVLDRALFVIVFLSVLASWPIVAWSRRQTIARATRYRDTLSTLTVIGITGSYGKSSTKEFLATILEAETPVVRTPHNVNTEIGIAQTVLRSLAPEHTIFICELGAYRLGEITRAARIIQPRLGVLTAVRSQHLGLFGSPQALARAKGELLEALPADGVAIVNGDDAACLMLSRHTRAKRVVRYGRGSNLDVVAEQVQVTPESLRVEIRVAEERAILTVPLLGEHQVGSLLAACAVACALGVPLARTVKTLEARVRPLPRTMEPTVGPSGSRIVDDSYSANPEGVVAALRYLQHTRTPRRVVVLTSMIELGSVARAAHRHVGEALGDVRPDLTILVSDDYAAEVLRGAAVLGTPPPIEIIRDARAAFERLRPLLDNTTTILLEGRIPETLRQSLLHP